MLGHMRRECDLAEGVETLEDISKDKIPFREWMRASPLKKASISVDGNKIAKDTTSLRRKLFDNFRQTLT
ncbi:hypothetical protein ACS0TY_013308 [Phlomoides rotata]